MKSRTTGVKVDIACMCTPDMSQLHTSAWYCPFYGAPHLLCDNCVSKSSVGENRNRRCFCKEHAHIRIYPIGTLVRDIQNCTKPQRPFVPGIKTLHENETYDEFRQRVMKINDLVLKIEHDQAHSITEYMNMIQKRGKLNYFIHPGKGFEFTTNQTTSYYIYSLEYCFVATLQVCIVDFLNSEGAYKNGLAFFFPVLYFFSLSHFLSCF